MPQENDQGIVVLKPRTLIESSRNQTLGVTKLLKLKQNNGNDNKHFGSFKNACFCAGREVRNFVSQINHALYVEKYTSMRVGL